MKKGFTLIELMGVLLVLSIMFLIGISSITKIIKENRQKLYNEQINSFIESASVWAMAHTNELPDPDHHIRLTLRDLIDDKLVKKGITNPITKEPFDENDYVCIFNVNGTYLYKYNDEC